MLGLDRLFGLGLRLLGLGSKTDPENPQALSDYVQQREEKRNKEKERQRLLEEAEKAAQGDVLKLVLLVAQSKAERFTPILKFCHLRA